jgi:hypothetical protein
MIPIVPSNNRKQPYMVSRTSRIKLQNGHCAYIPAGFLTNYASIPFLLKLFLNHIGVYRNAFVLHDSFYAYGGYFRNRLLTKFIAVSQREADREMWYQMKKLGSESWRAELYYQAVKYFGWLSFRK